MKMTFSTLAWGPSLTSVWPRRRVQASFWRLWTFHLALGGKGQEKGLGPQQVSGNYQAIYLFRFKSASFMPRGEVGCRARPPSIRGRKPRNTSRSSGPCHPGFNSKLSSLREHFGTWNWMLNSSSSWCGDIVEDIFVDSLDGGSYFLLGLFTFTRSL